MTVSSYLLRGNREEFNIPTVQLSERKEKDEYGDWQTNLPLALSVCQFLKSQGIRPQVIIEPTCGKGHFILAALLTFDTIEEVYGIEIYKPYLDELKEQIFQHSTKHIETKEIQIHLYHQSIFDFDFKPIKDTIKGREVLVIGNPPWVTNTKLGEIKSKNLPIKSNFKRVKGLDAITGKGNFDIAESICNQMVQALSGEKASLALLIKNSVIKNIIQEQKEGKLPINNISQHNITAQKEFGVSVAASLLKLSLDKSASNSCRVFDFYSKQQLYEYGWVEDKFVANISEYVKTKNLDGVSQLKWWSGLKHDCSKVMELSLSNGVLVNGYGKTVDIEQETIYPLLKSSDIKGEKITETRKYVIVTQHSTSDNTDILKTKYPKTYQYLIEYAELLDNRGSSIYKNRPRFCLFGIGKYSFKKYKVVVSGLYKHTKFALACPIDGKPVMLDDTCYLLGFDNYNEAFITLKILNSTLIQEFIHSLFFYDAKRVINKDLLMRINLLAALKHLNNDDLDASKKELEQYTKILKDNIIPIQTQLF